MSFSHGRPVLNRSAHQSNHWSLFPVVFKGRRFPGGVYDELMGMLVHGCFGEQIDSTLVFHEKSSSSIS